MNWRPQSRQQSPDVAFGALLVAAVCVGGARGGARRAAQRGLRQPARAADARRGHPTGVEASHRLAELRRAARRRGGRRSTDVRRPKLPQVAVAGRLHADEPRRRVRHPAADGRRCSVIYPDIPDNYRTRLDLQWPIYTAGRVDALERAARAEADATREGPRGRAQRPPARDHARVLGARHRARGGARGRRSRWRRIDAHLRDVRNRLQGGPRAAERRAVGRGAAVAPADAADRGAQRGASRPPPSSGGWSASPRRRPSSSTRCSIDLPAPPAAAGALVDEARTARPERQALESRLAGAGRAPRRGGGRQAAGRRRRRRASTTRGPNPRIFPRRSEWRTFVGRRRERDLDALGRRARRGRGRARPRPPAAGAEERLGEFDSVLEVEVRQRRLDLDSAPAPSSPPPTRVRAAAEARRVVERALRGRRRDQHRGARRAGGAAPGRARSHAALAKRAAGRGAAGAGARPVAPGPQP